MKVPLTTMQKALSTFSTNKRGGYLVDCQSNRDSRLDSLKGSLIILVVLGHMLEPYFDTPVNIILYVMIYSFHMPLFILLSGYFFNPMQEDTKFWRSTLKLLESLIVFWIIGLFVYPIPEDSLNISMLLTPRWSLWYILSLLFWRLSSYYLAKRGINITSSRSIIISFLISIAAGLIPISLALSFQRTLVFFPFFLIGMRLKSSSFSLKQIRIWIFAVPVLAAVLYMIVKYQGGILYHVCYTFFGNRPYSTYLDAISRGLGLTLGLILSLFIFKIFPRVPILDIIGTLTLPIYLLHIYGLKIFNLLIDHNILPSTTIYLMLYALLIIAIAATIGSRPFSRYILNPISSIARNFRQKPTASAIK